MVLVVESRRALARAICEVLRSQGIEAEAAFRAEEGIARAWETRPDAVLVATRLKSESGVMACRRIRDRADVRIVLLSDDEDPAMLRTMAGADEVVSPFDLEGILQAAERWSASRAQS